MLRRLCPLEGWQQTTRNLARGGSRILAVVALALTLLGASPSSFAQAAPANRSFVFYMVIHPSSIFVCAGQSLTFPVYVVRDITEKNENNDFGRISGISIASSLLDTSMGQVTPGSGLATFSEQGFEPGEVEFKFTAGNYPGTAYLIFKTTINGFWMGAGRLEHTPRPVVIEESVQVEVRQCGYSIQGWNGTVPGLSGGINCDSPFGPWDLQVTPQGGTTVSFKIYIPFANDLENSSAFIETHNPSVVGFRAFGTSRVTFTPTEWGYEMKIANSQMVGKTWVKSIPLEVPWNPVFGRDFGDDWKIFNIEPAQPGECSQP